MEPIIMKDGIYQVYTDCPRTFPDYGKCEGYVQESLGGTGSEPTTVYRCNECNTVFTRDELNWRSATEHEIKEYKSWKKNEEDYREAMRRDETQAYIFATWWIYENPDNKGYVPSYKNYLSFVKKFHDSKEPLSEKHFGRLCIEITD